MVTPGYDDIWIGVNEIINPLNFRNEASATSVWASLKHFNDEDEKVCDGLFSLQAAISNPPRLKLDLKI